MKAFEGIHCRDSRDLSFIPDEKVALTVTSPLYLNAKMDYPDGVTDVMTFDEYVDLHRKVYRECWRVTVPGGRIVINVANADRKPYVRLNDLHAHLLEEAGFTARAEIIWLKPGGSKRGSTAWGSWLRPSAPTIRDQHEYILVYQKGDGPHRGDAANATITKEEFLSYTMSVWEMNPAFAKQTKFPAAFPLELPSRAIKLWTYRNDLVLDPFMGSGTTCVAAMQLGRRFVGCDISPTNCEMARRNIEEQRKPA